MRQMILQTGLHWRSLCYADKNCNKFCLQTRQLRVTQTRSTTKQPISLYIALMYNFIYKAN